MPKPPESMESNHLGRQQPPIVRLEQVTKRYASIGSTRPALSDINLEIAAGDQIAIVGRSGSGKSTLLHLLGAVDRPTEGRIQVAGRWLEAMPERERTVFRRRRLGFIHQFFNLIPTLTVAENLRLPLELDGRRGPELDTTVNRLLNDVGLDDYGARFPESLSGGEQQRVAIARALIHAPDLVLADEPTGNLDATTGERVLDLLDRLVTKRGGTLVLVTHSRAVAEYANRRIALEDGRLSTTPIEQLAW